MFYPAINVRSEIRPVTVSYPETVKNGQDLFLSGIKFAKLNKNDTIEEYQNLVNSGDFREEQIIVVKRVILNSVDWFKLTNSLLTDRPELYADQNGEMIGGSILTDRQEEESPFKVWPETFWEMPERQREYWRQHSRLICIEFSRQRSRIVWPADKHEYSGVEKIWINPEGYEYARYVGLL